MRLTRGASPKTKSEKDVDDDVDDSSSSLDDVIDRELRNQRVTRAYTRARANAKVVEATAEARRAVEAEARAAKSVGDATASGFFFDSVANEKEKEEDHPEDASLRAERDRRSKRKLRRRLVRDALVALPVLVFSLYDTTRGERRRAAGAERAARRRAVLSADAASRTPRSPAKTRAAVSAAGDAKTKTSRSPYAVPSSTTMKVGANSYEVENGRVVTLATPAEAREVRKAFGMG